MRPAVLGSIYGNLPALAFHERAALLLWRWPEIAGVMQTFAAPFLFELPATRRGRLRTLPL